ncbi:hypothetical protein H6F47_11845 [Sphaerospermopsis sp. FACHB-1094]|uniref:hypothetical protein n=1 Tax=Sphaerospermopsis sp. FACHB-1094 TaxID=2692861 RepID=UPI001682D049|nr:hypothetical protein [Sphaerospermopsis sp. FACHB-1094]MBD2133103.1 hypothetical protein [Sphaerospermopsis sp. FACHB-1094]
MTLAYILTESDKDIEILQKLLPKNLIQDIKFIAGASSYRARSLASSLLATQKIPVFLIIDADTNNPSQVFEKKDLINYMLSQASSGIPFQISLAIPEIEIIFLQNKPLIEKIAQREFNDLEWQLAQSKPKEFLETVLGAEKPINEIIFSNINDEEIKILQQHPLIQEIITFLSSLTKSSVAIN